MNQNDFPRFVLEARSHIKSAWSGIHKIPWNEPGFSRRMLAEHLSQEHDLASRRQKTIDRHVDFIHAEILHGVPSHISDLGCGPGFYMQRLMRLGHRCCGIDFSPASVAYARNLLQCDSASVIEADLLEADFGTGYDLVMLLFGEFNTFTPAEGRLLLNKAVAALAPGGILLLEASRRTALKRADGGNPSWLAAEHGLFSDSPYICLQENRWFEDENAFRSDFFVLQSDGTAQHYASAAQAYSDEEYAGLLLDCGLAEAHFYGDYGKDNPDSDFVVLSGRKEKHTGKPAV